MIIDHLPSRTIKWNGVEHLFFSGTAYLGIGHQRAFLEALREGLGQYGPIFSASRNNNLQLKVYDEAEYELAQWTKAEAALTVTSGLLAGQLVMQSIDGTEIIYARYLEAK
jgi:8-amino-7-oxononanoate synthase